MLRELDDFLFANYSPCQLEIQLVLLLLGLLLYVECVCVGVWCEEVCVGVSVGVWVR